MATLPETKRFPFDETAIKAAIKNKDPEKLVEYIKKLVVEIKAMYEEIASVVNQNEP